MERARKLSNCATVLMHVEECLCEANEPVGEWVKIEAAVDSAAVDVVVPCDFIAHSKALKSKVSSQGRHYAGAK